MHRKTGSFSSIRLPLILHSSAHRQSISIPLSKVSIHTCSSGVLEFKFKEVSLFRELALSRNRQGQPMLKERQLLKGENSILVEAIQKDKPVRMNYSKELQFHNLAEFLFQKKDENKVKRMVKLNKEEIQMLQKLYVETLAKVYESARGVFIDLMKCIKPNAFLEIQGISTEMENTDNHSNLTEVP